jgi:7,8-dihydroneopterin aldolase/epimerase/oxygenase
MDESMFDCIHLSGIRGYGYTGALPEEQILGQWFEVELWLWLDLSLPATSDRLEDTLDYRDAIAKVRTLIESAKFTLIERLAGAIVESLLELTQVQQVQIHLTKVAPPIPNFSGQMAVELRRQKPPIAQSN